MDELDCKLRELLTKAKVEETFHSLVEQKTDIVKGSVRIARGCDGVDHVKFKKDITSYSKNICDKGLGGKYIFAPFKEMKVPKPPYITIAKAEAAGKAIGNPDKFIRTLSVSTIQDTLFQKLLLDSIAEYTEKVFKDNIDSHSWGYRKNKDSKMAVRKIRNYIDQGYCHVLDGDIQRFFDDIDHTLLCNKMQSFFGAENVLIQKSLHSFIEVDRIPVGKFDEYKSHRKTTKRTIGIPQGGVLSGLLANVFLFDFDKYVSHTLIPIYEFKYFRYADDFVLLFKSQDDIEEVHELLSCFLLKEKLKLHPIGEKTTQLDLSSEGKQRLDFLGFGISPKHLRVKNGNFKKFRNKIVTLLQGIERDIAEDVYFNNVCFEINKKIVGLEDLIDSDDGVCKECKKLIKKRSWIGYFMIVDDVRQLKEIDTMIRKEIYKDFHKRTKRHLRKKELLAKTKGILKSVEHLYYKYKKQIKKYSCNGFCNCNFIYDKTTRRIIREPLSTPNP